MKKWMSLLLAGALLLSLTACKKQDVSDSTPTDTQTQTPEIIPDAEALYKDFLADKLQATDPSGKAVFVSKYGVGDAQGKYAIYDMNGDAAPELIIKTPWYFDIYTVKDGAVALWHQNAAYCEVLNTGAILYERHGGGPTNVVYQYILLDAGGKEAYKLEFAEYIPDENGEHIYFIKGEQVEKSAYDAITGEILRTGQDQIPWKNLKDDSVYVADFSGFLAGLKADGSEAVYHLRDIDGNGIQELLLQEDGVLTVYTFTDGVTKVDAYEYGTGTFRMLSSDEPKYPGVITFWVGGGVNHYGYITVKDGKLSHERLWDEMYSQPENDPGRVQEFSADKGLLDASKTAYAQNRDLQFQALEEEHPLTDGLLLKVLRNESVFTATDGQSLRLENYKLFGSQKAVVDRYAFVDFDGNGVNELVAYMAPDLGYMVFRWEQGTVYGYEFVVRGMQSLKADGTHRGSGGASVSGYFALRFKDGKCEQYEHAYQEDILGNEEYRIDGKSVTRREFMKFLTAFESKPDASWKPFA